MTEKPEFYELLHQIGNRDAVMMVMQAPALYVRYRIFKLKKEHKEGASA